MAMIAVLGFLLSTVDAQVEAGDPRAADEVRFLKELQALIEKKERSQDDELQVVAKARELGKVGTARSVDFLVRHIEYRSGLRMVNTRQPSVRDRYPFVGTLTDIGASALGPVLELLGSTDEAGKTTLARVVLYGVGLKIFGTVDNGARANRFAQGTIEAAIGDPAQPRAKRLAASAAYFAGRAKDGIQSEPQ